MLSNPRTLLTAMSLILIGCGGPQQDLSTAKIVNGEEVPYSQSDLRAMATVALTTDLGPADEGGLLDTGKSFCTGTVIGKRVIMTAAHCVQSIDPETQETEGLMLPYERDFIVFFGNKVSRQGSWIRAQHVIPHASWLPKETLSDRAAEVPNDIAVIILESDVPRTAQIAPIAPLSAEIENGDAYVVGFGVTVGQRAQNDTGIKRQATIQVRNVSSFEKRLATGIEQGVGVCSGDSGGPAYFKIDGQFQVVGVASTGEMEPDALRTCTGRGKHTDARAYRDWIDREAGAFL